MKEKLKKSNIILFIILLLASSVIIMPTFINKFDILLDDGIQHLYRIIGNKQAFSMNIKNLSIFSEFCNGFGYSWNLFYSPLTSFLFFILGFINLKSIRLLEISMCLITLLSLLSMFVCMNKMIKNKYISALGAVMYIAVPYRLTNMYIRVAIAELASFIFLPIVFLGMYEIYSEKKKNTCTLAIGSIGVILTHQVIGMYTAFFCAIYLLFHINLLIKKDVIKNTLINGILIIMVIIFYAVPLFEQKQATNYEVFKEGRMEREEVMEFFKLSPEDLVYTKQDAKMTYEIGYITLLGLLFTPFVFRKLDEKFRNTYLLFLLFGILSEVMTLKIFPFEKLPDIFKYLQFTFRMLTFSSYFLTFVAAVNIGLMLNNKISNYDVFMISIIICGLLVKYSSIVPRNSEIYTMDFNNAIPVTYNTNRVHAGCASFEYLPSKAYDNLNYIIERKNVIKIIEGNALINNYKKENGIVEATLEKVEANTVLELPYIYYLGYNVEIENNNEKEIIQNFESDKGFVAIRFDKELENCNIRVEYVGTKVQDISYIISIAGAALLFIVYIYNKNYYKKVIKKIEKGKDV